MISGEQFGEMPEPVRKRLDKAISDEANRMKHHQSGGPSPVPGYFPKKNYIPRQRTGSG